MKCRACGHEHAGADLAFICVGCPCSAQPGREECLGCETQVHLTTDKDGRLWCDECCPQLFCKACLSSTGGSCREHATEGREPWGPGWF